MRTKYNNLVNIILEILTNLDVKKHTEDIILYKTYKGNVIEYPKYENYNAIDVSKVADIPIDYNWNRFDIDDTKVKG